MMKKIYSIFILIFLGNLAIAQQTILTTSQSYQLLKESGKLKPGVNYKFIDAQNANSNSVGSNISLNNTASPIPIVNANSSCQCMVPVDATFTVVPFSSGTAPDYRNDDGSSPSIPLGFNFCFYGDTYTSCYINTNGNITFGSSSSVYSSTGFPTNTVKMIAPFWADVDTRNAGSGLVYYKKTATSLIVKWSSVGYFNSKADLKNDFQLIITNGSDPILSNGNNVAFCYGDMQWTTGLGGTNGFGGTPATAGVNKGSGNSFIQLGRFDKAGIAYDGPYGSTDGVSFLDNKSYFFNTCGSNNNLPPIVQDATGGGSTCGDTVKICALGDTLVYTTSFLAPETGQTVTVNASAPTLGASFQPLGTVTNASGVTTFSWRVVATPTVTGVHTVIITGTDNGNPPLSSSATYFIKVQNIPVPQPILAVNPNTGTVCATPGATLTLTNFAAYDNVYWSDGSSGTSIVANTSGVHYVTVSALGCYKSSSDTVNVWANPNPVLSGGLNYCAPATNATLSILNPLAGQAAYATYTWSPGAINTPTATLTSGTKTLTVTDVNGCKGTKIFTISTTPITASIIATPPAICGTGTINLAASVTGVNYTWSPTGANTQTIDVSSSGSHTVLLSANGCTATAVKNVVVSPTPTVSLVPQISICSDVLTTTVTALSIQPTGAYSYTWSTGENSSVITVGSNSVITVKVTNTVTECVSLVSNQATVTAVPLPTVSFAQDVKYYCGNTTGTLTPVVTGGTPNFTYQWSPPSLGSSATATTNASVGNFTVLVTDSVGCAASATVSVVKSTPGIIVSTTDDKLCPDQCVYIKANGLSNFKPGTYSWIGNASVIDSIFVCAPGTYSVTFTDSLGCTATGVQIIGLDDVPVASFTSTPGSPVGPNQTITFTDISTIANGGIASATWSFGDGGTASGSTVNYGYPNSGSFPVILTITGTNGCKDTASTMYVITATINIPNVITPNGDGANDYLKFKNLEFFGNNNLTIMNRWGKKIYEQSNYKNDWNGSGLTDGTYFFVLEVPSADPKTYKGHFEIIR